MDGVVRTDQKIRSGALQYFCRTQHQLRHRLPPGSRVNRLHVVGQADGMHGDFRMRMPAHQRLRFQTDRPVTERRSFRTAADNADVLCHPRKSIWERSFSFLSTGRNEASMELRASSRRCSSEKLNSCCAISYSLFSEVWNIAGSSEFSVIINPSSKNFRTGCSFSS